MTEPTEDTQAWNPEDVDAIRRDVEEEDESGAPEKVAWPKTDDAPPLEAVDELREPPYERGEDVTESGVITGGKPADDH
jgi:hypothetical protein